LYFIFGLTAIASAGYIPLFYTEGNLIWWYSHLAFPIGYTAIFVGLINYEKENLNFSLFFGDIPFYKKIGTRLALTIFLIGLFPLLAFGLLMFFSVQNSLSPMLLFRFVLMVSLLFVLSAFFSFYFASRSLALCLHNSTQSLAKDSIQRAEWCYDNRVNLQEYTGAQHGIRRIA